MIATPAEIKQYLPTGTINATYFEVHEARAIMKHLPKYLGYPLAKALLADNPAEPIATLIEKLKGAIINLAFAEASPLIDVVPTNTGFGIVSTQNLAPASAQRVQAFIESALKAADDYISDALFYIEEHQADYPTWNKSSLIEGGLIASIEDWPNEIEINYSRVKFVNLVPFIKRHERLLMHKKFSPQFVASIAGTDDLNVLPDMKKALAFAAYSEFMAEIKDTTPGVLSNLTAESEAYVSSALDYLTQNLESYPVYMQYAYEEPFENDLTQFGFLKLG